MTHPFIHNMILVLQYYAFSLVRGTARKQVKRPGKFVVVQNAKLGDMVCTTPVFGAIKKTYPNAHITVVGNALNQKLLEGNNDVSDYIVFNKNKKEVINQLRKRKIDYGIVVTPDVAGLHILFLSKVKTIVCPSIEGGFSPYETKTYKLLRLLTYSAKHTMGTYAPGQYLNLLNKARIYSTDTKKHLSFSPEASEKINALLHEQNINIESDFLVGISPSAGNKIKNWGGEHFSKVAEYLAKKYSAKIIIIGSGGDAHEVNEMVSHLSPKIPVFNTLNLLSLDELKALISKMHMFISVDTGPLYIAEAFSVPTIDIIGPMDENEQPPQGRLNRIVKIPDRKKPELHIMNARVYNTGEALRQINSITEAMVIDEIENLIAELNK